MSLPPAFLEGINGVLFVLFFWVMFWFAYDIFSVRRESGSWRITYREAAASIACLVAFFGDWIIRGSVWYYRHLENDGLHTAELMKLTTFTITVGVGVMIAGCACIIHHLSPNGLGRLPWAIAVSSSLFIWIWLAF